MFQVPVNYLAIVVAAVVSMIFGALWFGPLFGKTWMKLSGLSSMGRPGKMTQAYVVLFLSTLVMSFVLANALIFASAYTKIGGVSAGLMSGFFNWLGFIAPVTLGTVLWEGKSWKLWFLNNGYQLISLLLMGVILALWK